MFDLVCKLNRLFIVIFNFLTKLAIKFHTSPYILPLKWCAHEPGFPVQQPRDLVPRMVIAFIFFYCCLRVKSHVLRLCFIVIIKIKTIIIIVVVNDIIIGHVFAF